MKKFTFLLILISFTILLSAQHSETSLFKQHYITKDNPPKEFFPERITTTHHENSYERKASVGNAKYLKKDDVIKQILDSIIFQNYDTLTTKWFNSHKYVFVYDTLGNIISYHEFEYDSETLSVHEVFRKDYIYNSDGDIITYTEQTETDGMLVNSYREIYTYDEMGQDQSFTTYHWDKDKSDWVENYKEEYHYNEFGEESSYVEFLYDTISKEWIPDYKEEYVFNTNLLVDTYTGYKWNKDESKWDESNKGTYSYFDDDLPESFTLQIKNELSWQNSSQELYTYSIDGQILSTIIAYWQISQWVNLYKYLYAYNSYGLKIIQSLLLWSGTDWQNNYKIEYSYNNDQLASMIYSNWDVATLAWIYFYRKVYTLNILYSYINLILPSWYTAVDFRYMVLSYVYSLWNSADWLKYEKGNYYYSSVITHPDNIPPNQNINFTTQVYPNPSSGYIFLNWDGDYKQMNIKIFDLSANLVLDKNVANHSRLNIEQLQRGNYIYKMEYDGQQMSSGKISVE